VHLHYGESETLYYRLGAQSEGVTITIFNDSGNLVQTLKKAGQAAGEQSLTWNGKNSNGERLPEGDYTFRVEAADKIGNPITTETFISGVIEGVGYNNNNAHLVISGNQVPFTSLISETNN
jgi:flagellar basal-body rod modification protein FlgD